ncbi:MAG: tetratricopeptide repeat protein [Rhodospirillales bacterium]
MKNSGCRGRPGLSALETARADEAAGRLREAVAGVRDWLAAHPGDPDGLVAMARLALRLGRAEVARDFAGQTLERDADHREAVQISAAAFRALGDLAQADRMYDRLLRLDPANPSAWNEKGNLALAMDQPATAVDCFRRALGVIPDHPMISCNLGLALGHAGRHDAAAGVLTDLTERRDAPAEAFDHLSAIAALRGDMPGAEAAQLAGIDRFADRARSHLLLARLRSTTGDREGAAEAFRQCLRLDPENREAAFVLSTMGEGETPETPPDEFYAGLFDYYADFFEWHLKEKLGYCGHDLIRASVEGTLGPGQGALEVLDVGCGTGLCGAAVEPWARAIDGMDFAPKMIRQATRRGLYRQLEACSALDFLKRTDCRYDLVVAADVFGYIGNPLPLMTAVRSRLKAGGHFCFTAELGDVARFGMGDHIRYVFHPDFLTTAADETGFEILSRDQAVMRHDGDEPIRVEVLLLAARD